jgi:hypothetical protein
MRNKTILLKINSIFFFCVIATSYQLLIPTIANAQTVPLQSMKVTPIINDLHLTPGEKTTIPLTIQNLSSDPIGIHTQLSGYDQIGEVPVVQQKPSAIIIWTHLSKTDILVPPHSQKVITVTIIPLAHLSPSGYYETIFLTPIVNQEVVPGHPIILSRIGVLILGTIGTLDYNDLAGKVGVTDFSPSHTLVDAFPKAISFAVDNYYFTHFDAKPFLTITPLFGKAQTTLLPDKHVLPGSARVWQYQPQSLMPDIFYSMHLAVAVGGGKQVVKDTWFFVLPYNLILLVVVIIFILFIIFFRPKRIGRAIKILFKG